MPSVLPEPSAPLGDDAVFEAALRAVGPGIFPSTIVRNPEDQVLAGLPAGLPAKSKGSSKKHLISGRGVARDADNHPMPHTDANAAASSACDDDDDDDDDVFSPQKSRTERLESFARRVLRFTAWVAIVVAMGLAALSPSYERGASRRAKGGPLSRSEAAAAAARFAIGAALGRLFAQIFRKACWQARTPLFVMVIEAFETAPLEAACFAAATGLAGASTFLRAVTHVTHVPLYDARLARPVERRLRVLLVNVGSVALLCAAQEFVLARYLGRWAASKYSERVFKVGAATRVLRALAAVAADEKHRAAAEELAAGSVIAHKLAKMLRRASSMVDVTFIDSDINAETAQQQQQQQQQPTAARRAASPVNAAPPLASAAEEAKKTPPPDVESFMRAAALLRIALSLGPPFGSVESSDECRRVARRVFRLVRGAARRSATASHARSVGRVLRNSVSTSPLVGASRES